MRVRAAPLAGAALLALSGCSTSTTEGAGTTPADEPSLTASVDTTPRSTVVESTAPPTTLLEIAAEPSCVVTVAAGDFLARIATSTDGVTVEEIQDENGLVDDHIIHPGDELDVCIGNDVDDVTGASRLAPAPAAVRRQQEKLNKLFASYRIADLVVDGDSGALTRQLLCTARMGAGAEPTMTHMAEDSGEEDALFEAAALSTPVGAAIWAEQWVLIDKTCQVMFAGERERIVDIYPTSTGSAGFETRDAQAAAAFRYDPAVDTDGWHDSSAFPVEVDNPLNGNMYKPIYFNNGQAIHGANYVPPEPRSKGCARMFPWHQDELISWLGLADIAEPTWNESTIGVTVTVQGDYRRLD